MKKLSETERYQLNQRIRLNMDESDAQLFSNAEKRRVHIGRERRRVILCWVAVAVFYILSVLLVCDLMNNNFSFAWWMKHFLRRCNDVIDLIAGNHLQSGIHFWLTQYASALIAGMALGASGACFQALFHNPMASPTMLGIEAGGTLGKTVFLLFFYTPLVSAMTFSYDAYSLEVQVMTIWQRYSQYILTFFGCIAVVIAILIVSKVSARGKLQTVPLVVGGTIFTTSVEAFLNLFIYYTANYGDTTVLSELESLQAGSYTAITIPTQLLLFAIPALVPLPIMLLLSGRLNVIAFGEDEARAMGVSVGVERVVLILLSTIMTAAVVSFCGAISFVGLMIPHIARYFVGQDLKYVLPVSTCLGGIFMLLAFDVSYMMRGFVDAGSVVNVAGGLIFLVFMIRSRMLTGHGSFN
ncbi:MAG: iron ABC transporter permease [Oscillospiraceae bacterium]|nr:iron ABC transporter permease [Oscillospiraceae bacterium]